MLTSGTGNARQAFELADWRGSVAKRRELFRSIIVRATIGREQLEPILAELKAKIGHHKLDENDRKLFNVVVHDIRTVVGGWAHLTSEEQKRFVAGKGAPSTTATLIRQRHSSNG